ncbi:hypothetical protein [uncultured Acetatifactor sp.]|uniref:hypothetical protein n=2 Tax=uncultured Acetatifactor sp. TaxID=1671927 RepID=UPI002ED20DB5
MERMKIGKKNWGKLSLLLLPLAAIIVGLAVWGPEALARYRDRGVLNQIQEQESGEGTEGYRYSLGGNEKVYILAQCLNNQVLPESDQNAMTRNDLENLELTGTYAFVANRKDASGQEVPESTGIELGNQGIRELKSLGVLPDEVQELTENDYRADLYSAIDVPEPQNNVLVWKIGLSTGARNADRQNRLLDAYVDADTGKVYEFYVRTEISSWAQVDADGIAAAWAEYMELGQPTEYENTNPLSENTPYFRKYTFAGTEEGDIVVTIGYYEGINELYLKISR